MTSASISQSALTILSCTELFPEERSPRNPLLLLDDEPFMDALAARGVTTRLVDWRATSPDDLLGAPVLIRSPWNYVLYRDEYLSWMERAKACGLDLINPVDLVLGTLSKTYLIDLGAAGLPAIPTRILERDRPDALGQAFGIFACDTVVVKPAIGAGARNTFRIAGPVPSLPPDAADVYGANETILVQPYLHDIEAQGEISAMVFGGRLGHMVRKTPAQGDFRVQVEHGGRTERIAEDPAIVEAALAASAHYGHPAYIRVDGVMTGAGWRIMELEMIEPELFFTVAPESAALFADGLVSRINQATA